MARSRVIHYAALNVAATPHPDGVYARVLNAAATIIGPAHGSDSGKLTRPQTSTIAGVVLGRILIWTDIDLKGRWLDTTSEQELSPEERRKIQIPDNAKPNARVFSYAFHLAKHRLYFETRNEFGDSLGPQTAFRLVSGIMDRVSGRPSMPSLAVTLVPRKGVVKKILALEGLRKLDIELTVPNPDDVDPAVRRRIYEKLRANKARKWEQTLTKVSGEARLTPTQEVQDFAELAAENGKVTGWGKEDGRNVELRTTAAPRTETAKLDDGQNFAERILASRGFF